MNRNLFAAFICVSILIGPLPTLAASTTGIAFTMGDNRDGQLGNGSTGGLARGAIVPTSLGGRLIKQVDGGFSHSLLLAEDGVVFTFGHNGNGMTGLGTAIGSTLIATPIDTTNLGGHPIAQVATGSDHSLLLADDGTVFGFGMDLQGRTGLGNSGGRTTIATPIDTTNLGGRAITQIAASFSHSLLLADDGTVFSFGNNAGGKTGLGLINGETLIATPIDTSNLGGRTITQIAAGDSHSLLLADDGTVFSFGDNRDFGATGQGTFTGSTTVATSIDDSNLGGRVITQIAAGGLHNLLLADDGTLLTFGDNNFGQGAIGPIEITAVATPSNLPELDGQTITQIAGGQNHSLLIVIPEPASMSLLGLGGLVVLRRGR